MVNKCLSGTGTPMMLSFCGGVGWVGGEVWKVIFMSNLTAVLRLRLCWVDVGVVTIIAFCSLFSAHRGHPLNSNFKVNQDILCFHITLHSRKCSILKGLSKIEGKDQPNGAGFHSITACNSVLPAMPHRQQNQKWSPEV